jgi:LemA protein
MALGIVAGVAVLIALVFLSTYNGLVRSRNTVKNSYSQIDVQLKRRYELIPNLIEVAKASMKHEKETLEQVIKARNQALQVAQTAHKDPTDGVQIQNLASAENQLGQAMTRFVAVMESYPDLKANSTLNVMLEEISSTENKVSFARQAYNDSVLDYNNAREVFPSSLVGGFFRFKEASPFEITQEVERQPIKVAF